MYDVKKEFLFNDFVVQYNQCNFSCEYCLNKLKPDETEIWKITNQFQIPSYAESEVVAFEYDGELKRRIDNVMRNFQQAIDAPILRISGGEILGMKDVKYLLAKACEQYEIVQIVTNGFYLDYAMTEYMKNLGKIHIHLSLDGHTSELNYYRVKSMTVQQKLLSNLENCIRCGIPIEISSVLTNRNTEEYEAFLQYLMQYSDKRIKVFPAPVRGNHVKHLYPTREDIEKFKTILIKYQHYKEILPPKQYLSNLIEFLETKNKKTQCLVPLVAVQSLDNGSITACPNGWTSQITNLCIENQEEIIKKINSNKMYTIMTQERPRLKYCRECFTAYEIINLFLGEQISERELCLLPLYNNEKVLTRLKKIKESLKESVIC